MTILYGLLTYLLIGLLYAIFQIGTSIMAYPRVMTKGGIGRALNSIPNLGYKVVAVIFCWILIPIGAILRAVGILKRY